MPRKKSQSDNISSDTVVPMQIEIRFKELMVANNLHGHGSVEAVAKATNLSRHTVTRLLKGETANVSMDTICVGPNTMKPHSRVRNQKIGAPVASTTP